jgi:hypothetical protein
MKKKMVCRLLNETPGALRYREVDNNGDFIKGDEQNALIGDLYLRKAALSEVHSDKIVVTIESP